MAKIANFSHAAVLAGGLFLTGFAAADDAVIQPDSPPGLFAPAPARGFNQRFGDVFQAADKPTSPPRLFAPSDDPGFNQWFGNRRGLQDGSESVGPSQEQAKPKGPREAGTQPIAVLGIRG
ncbi:MAG: hypothetical protein ACPGU7_13855 [Gammaproteobacteria bacterium]